MRNAGPGWVQYTGRRAAVVTESDDFPEPRRGIVLKGGCDLPAVFTAAPLMREGIKGTIAITRNVGGTGGNRSDQILDAGDSADPRPGRVALAVHDHIDCLRDQVVERGHRKLVRRIAQLTDEPEPGEGLSGRSGVDRLYCRRALSLGEAEGARPARYAVTRHAHESRRGAAPRRPLLE